MTQKQTETALRTVLTAEGLASPAYAVAVPVIFGREGPELLIEIRAAGISQAGDPCFPGGRIEPGESPAQAAARELEEELGIRVEPDRFLGRLPTVRTYLGSKTDAFVCVISPEEAESVRLAETEVAELLRVPLSFFQSCPEAASYEIHSHTVWGMTAGAIRHLCAVWQQAERLEGKLRD